MTLRAAFCVLALVASCGCDRTSGKSAKPGVTPASDAQMAEAAWRRWQAGASSHDGHAAWACLSTRSRAERASLYIFESARVGALSGAPLEAAAKDLGFAPDKLKSMRPEDFAIEALSREFRRSDNPAPGRGSSFVGIEVKGDLAIVRATSPDGRPQSFALVREPAHGWLLDDQESRRLPSH